jgi:tRNA1(Val) A37 N6-methylase TrmN6
MRVNSEAMLTTDGHLLAGQVRYRQPKEGFRSALEPVLLAAAIPARPGETVLEGGTGAGAALLCLAARVPGLRGIGIELDPGLAALAQANAAANNQAGLRIVTGDVTTLGLTDAPPGGFHHAFANPPYHAADGTPSPMADRERAKRGSAAMLATWAKSLGAHLRRRGTLTFIVPAVSLESCLTAMTLAGCAPAAVLPLWPRCGRSAKLILVQGIRGSRSPLHLLAGLTLHRDAGAFTAEAEAILRDGAALPMNLGPPDRPE